MDRPTKNFKKAVTALTDEVEAPALNGNRTALTEELEAPALDTARIARVLKRIRKHLTAGAVPTDKDYYRLRWSYQETHESLPSDSKDELKDLAFTVAEMLFESTLIKVEADAATPSRDEDLLDWGYGIWIDVANDCGCCREDWIVRPTPTQYQRFLVLPAPSREQAKCDWDTLQERFAQWNIQGLVSEKF